MIDHLVRQRRTRRGITLLEVMISIGVAFMGLLGVVAVLPLAAHYMNRGVVSDTSATFGRSTVSNLDISGALRTDNWAIWNPLLNRFVEFSSNPQFMFDPNTGEPVTFVPPGTSAIGASFCIDPLLISRLTQDGIVPPSTFPDVGMTTRAETRMARVTLRILPGEPVNSGADVIQPATVDSLQRLTDELVIALPKDRTELPIQQFSNSTSNVAQKRGFDGTLSWMATLTPIVDADGGVPQQDMYLLSVVIMERRPLVRDAQLEDQPERVVNVNQFYGGGFAGGDMQFITRPGRPENDIHVRPGDWVMLSARAKINGDPSSPGASVFRWYRVVSADNESVFDNANQVYMRDVFLDGADWNSNQNVAFPTQATLISGVVAVFEKTIRLEKSSLWTAQF